jgi:CarD family transcriptional regulator
MFSVGELLIYGTSGVCRVDEICSSPFDAADTRLFYKLTPTPDRANLVIYTPVDNEKVIMRPLMSEADARELLASISEIGIIEVPLEKKRRDIYRELVATAEPRTYVSIIKTVAHRREEFKRTRRRLPDIDNDAEHTAKSSLYGELAAVLGLSREEIHNMITEKTL